MISSEIPPQLATLPVYPPLIRERPKKYSAPVSFTQERLWFLDQIDPGDKSANISWGVRIQGDLDIDLLTRSLQAIVDRHESLRTTFATNQLDAGKDSKPVQFIAAGRTVEIPIIDLSRHSANARHRQSRDIAKSFVQDSFDLTLGPLSRATLLKLSEREHILLLSLHRIICDDWSVQILMNELWAAYGAYTRNELWPISPEQLQYADYAVWQRQLVAAESFQPELDYWHSKLKEAPSVSELPTDRPRSPQRTWHAQSVLLDLDPDLFEKLRVIGSGVGASLSSVLLAALRVVLTRHSRQQETTLGTISANREIPEIKDVIGPVSNLLSLRCSMSDDPTFLQLVIREQDVALEAYKHRLVPFEKLLDELQVERSLSHTPVFQVTFNLNEHRDAVSEVAGLKLEQFEFDDGDIVGYDLMVDVFTSPHTFCRFRYSTDLFDQATIERFAGHYKRILDEIVNDPNQRVFALQLLTKAEREQILIDWNNTETKLEQLNNLSELFQRQASLTPAAVAIAFQKQQLTYAELNASTNQLAHYLRARGIGPDVLVGIFVDRSIEMVIALLAVLKAGGAYLPLDPAYPAERLRFMLSDSNARLVLTQETLLKLLPESQADVFCLDRDWSVVSEENAHDPNTTTTPQNLAYVIYTSGSTGKPKGVAIEHRSALAFLGWARTAFSNEELTGVLASTSICFDLSVFEIFLPLNCGGKVLVVENLLHLPSFSQPKDVTLVNTVPSAMAELLQLGGLPENVQTVNLAGEPLRSDLVKQLYQLPKIKRVNDLYGPSEDTTYSTYVRRHSDGPTTIGRPIANTQLYLLDANLQPVPIGVSGEIYLGGSGLARGYVKRPELTAQAFVPDPFSGKPGARLYKTGDLARYLPDGNVEYLGRLDHQVKVRGFRIELGEIETVLREHSSVRDVVVVAREGKLIAYVVTFEEQSDNCAELWSQLRSLVKSKLPEYMLPAAFVELDTLPFTTSGKVDRNNLPTPDESRPELQQAYVAPRDRIEEQLVMLWANVLKLKTVGVLDNFFELGGHSLLAARLFAQIENRFGKHLPLATLFRSPTIAQLAKVLRDEGTETSWSSLIAIQPEGTKPPLFCIHAAGANVLIYRPLSRHLGNEQPVYALQAQGLDGQSQPLTTVEEMAARYIKEIRAFQPQGPYHLLGASFGGLVIYEMACQLRQQNQNVGLVAMLNTNCPVYSLGKRVASHVAHLRQLGPRSYGMAVVKGMARRFNRYLPDSLKFNGGANGALRPEFELKQLLETRQDRDEALVQTVSAILRAEETYDPRAKIYPGKLTLFRAIDANNELDDNRLGWKYFAQEGLEVYDVPGTHTSIREEPNVAVLAEKLKYCLDRVQLTTTQAI